MSMRIIATLSLWMAWASVAQSQTPAPEAALQYRPSQKDVEYDVVAVADLKKCRVELETIETKGDKKFGFAVFDSNGQILRRYLDLNGDRYIDLWRYYKNGLETYRDIDTNFNQKIDQCRWLNSGGSRWGIDKDEDGKIDSWKQLSAEEASRVAVNAMIAGDTQLFATVLISSDDCDDLGISAEIAKELLKQVQEPGAAIKTLMTSQKELSSTSKWTRLDASMPGLVPADDGKAKFDLTVYEGAMAFVETSGKHGIVQIGEMIKVGDVWKLTQIPKPIAGGVVQVASGGLLMRPTTQGPVIANELSARMQELLKNLQDLEKASPQPGSKDAAAQKFHAERKRIIRDLIQESKNAEQRDLWTQQLINQLMTEVQYGDLAGIKGLQDLESTIRQQSPKSPLIAYTAFRRGFAEYSLSMQGAKDPKSQQAANESWLKWLEQFVKNYPESSDAIDATIQLAVNSELSGDAKGAKQWYSQLADRTDSEAARDRGKGALRRLDLVGKKFELKGTDINGKPLDIAAYRGKATLVVFWSLASQEFAVDLPVLKGLLDQYKPRGFEILGVCLDDDPKQIAAFAQQNKVTWESVHDAPNGKNPWSLYYAIPSPLHYFLVDKDGLVVANNITVNELKDRLAQQPAKKP